MTSFLFANVVQVILVMAAIKLLELPRWKVATNVIFMITNL